MQLDYRLLGTHEEVNEDFSLLTANSLNEFALMSNRESTNFDLTHYIGSY